MNKTHKEFLTYVDEITSGDNLSTVEGKTNLVIEICHKIKNDFHHLAKYLGEVDGEEFLGVPVIDSYTDYFLDEYGATEDDTRVLETIQGLMQNCDLQDAILEYDEAFDAHSKINYLNVMRLHALGYKVYVHAAFTHGDGLEPLPDVYIDLGEVLLKL